MVPDPSLSNLSKASRHYHRTRGIHSEYGAHGMGWSRQEKVRKAGCEALRASAAAAQQGMGSKNTLSISSCVSIAATSPKQAHACADVGGQRWLHKRTLALSKMH